MREIGFRRMPRKCDDKVAIVASRPSSMPRILGIDPGSRITGFGLVDAFGARHAYLHSGSIHIPAVAFPERLRQIFNSLGEVIDEYRPEEVAIEQVFVRRNPDSALKLGQARGAAICAAVTRGLVVSEYTPAEIKRAVVGGGRAEKHQVQHMVCVLLALSELPQPDAADALGVALCHATTSRTTALMGLGGHSWRRRRR